MTEYISAERYIGLQALEAAAPPPPLFAESVYLVSRDGIEHRYRFDTTAAGLRLHHAMRHALLALLREREDWHDGRMG